MELAEPPVLGEPAGADFGSALMYLPMGLGAGAMVLMFSVRGMGPTTYMMSGMMGVAMISMTLTQLGRGSAERRRRMRAERRDYLRYLSQKRRQARTAAEEQRAALLWDNPAPDALWAFAMGPRLWERRPSHEDFGRIRIGIGVRRAQLGFLPPQTKPVEDLEPLTAISLRRFTKAHQAVPGLPIPVALRRFSRVEFAGAGQDVLALIRAMVAQLAVLHAPDELRIAVLGDTTGAAEWDWVKWLPHNAHPAEQDDAGAARLAAADLDTLMALLGPEVRDRPDHDPQAAPSIAEPYVVIIAQGAELPPGSRPAGEGLRNTLVLDATGTLRGGDNVLRLSVREGVVMYPAGDGDSASAAADGLGRDAAERLARYLSPLRAGSALDLTERPLDSDFELTSLLGIRDPRGFDVAAVWRPRQAQAARLAVPLGVTEDGEVVELDLKESAQGGMGPHGLLIGATGSGKSELLRTLVMGLAATHSSEVLNLVLVDFKGGATFLHMDRLPHTSAVITNLADEIHLVDRMRDSINGEMIRRQEVLRKAGFSSLFDYEKARLGGAGLTPLPSLLIIVDEFSELLASKPEFVDLFVSVGRLGRSLGVHLLLASQRLDESRIHKVEGHLSYRLALRTFSSMESRGVIGVSSAYELPSAPGNGYLKVDTTNLVRFKAAYVSGPAPQPVAEADPVQRLRAVQEVTPFGLDRRGALSSERESEPQAPAEVPVPSADGEPVNEESLLEVLIDRLEEAGPPARQVWLPPLDSSVSLDQVLPAIVPDPVRGMSAADFPALGALRVPLGMVDKPYEQARELLVADLSGAEGHIGLVGAPQTGKSTMLRTLMLSLALTHTAEEIQFYCLDFGGGGLVSTSGLPHVGSVATRLDRDRVQRTVAELTQLLERREAEFAAKGLESVSDYRALRAAGEIDDPYGDVFLVVDGWGTLRGDYDDIEPRVIDLAARGLSYGIHVMGSAVRWSEFRPRLRDLLGSKFELRLGDALESEVGSRAAATVPHQPGRGLTSGGHHFLAALPRLDSAPRTEDLTTATKEAVAEISTFWTGRTAPGVRLLPSRLPAARLPRPEGDLRVCLGWDEQRLAPAWHDFSVNPHLLAFGDGETGKTNVLRLMIEAITARYTPAQARIMVADPGRGLLSAVPEEYRVGYVVDSDALGQLAASAALSVGKRVPAADISPENLARRDWWSGPLLFVLIDDYDLFSGAPGTPSPMTPLLPLLSQAPYIGLHLVVARSTSSAMRAMMDPLLRRLWELGNPALVFSYPKEEGKFIGEAKPRALPVGRAQLVTRRSVKLVQTGLVDPP
ncbi:type VII secretion protein EccCa [Actinacidiphila alni]|uniref:type VII secretion protein EccCa n=1 Tax=Actinacidiphila alni TaxID=380248 RepID=UPI0034536676